jgi:large subunit ribosomal protein L22
MGKPSRERSLADNEAQAVVRRLRISPQKLNLVAAMIRGKKVERRWPISPSRASASPWT